MKKIKELKESIILENGYGKPEEEISPNSFNNLSDEEKKKCTKGQGTGYTWHTMPADIPELTNEEVMLIMAEANYKNIKIIKYCAVFFTVIAVASALFSLLAYCALIAQ